MALRGSNRDYLLKVATAQKHVLYVVLAYVLLIVVNLVLGRVLPGMINVGMFAFLAVAIAGAITVYRLASLFRSKVVAAIYLVGLLVPCLGLLLLLSISQEATRVLKENGIKVGLLGANLDDI